MRGSIPRRTTITFLTGDGQTTNPYASEQLPETAEGLIDWIEGSIKIEIRDWGGQVFFIGYLSQLRAFGGKQNGSD